MLFAIAIFILLMSVLLIFSMESREKDDNSILSMRKNQNPTNFRQNALKKKLEQMAEEKAKFDKKYKIETMCLQAGYKISYGEYKILSIGFAVILPIIIGISSNNIIMSLMFIPVGYMLPGQFISFAKNRRVNLMQKQVGSFIKLVIERYKSNGDFPKAIEACLTDFKGQEPMYSELKETIIDINLNIPTGEAMDKLARRTGNEFLKRLADYYKITADLGTKDSKENLLNQAYLQYEDDRSIKLTLKKEINGPVRESYFMVFAIPFMVAYKIATDPTYITFMTNTTTGKIGSAVIIGTVMGAVWFINAKIGAPLK